MLSLSEFDILDAAHEIATRTPNAGDMIRHEELWSLLGVPHYSTWNKPIDIEEFRSAHLLIVNRWGDVQKLIREHYKFGYVSVPSVGYRRRSVDEDVALTRKQRTKNMRKAAQRAEFEIVHSDVEAMTEQQRQERTRALVHFQTLHKALGGRRRKMKI